MTMTPRVLVFVLATSLAATTTAATRPTSVGTSQAATQQPLIVYSTDWGGPSQLYAADPRGKAALAQVTFGREPSGCRYSPVACGYVKPAPSPDGRWIVYRNAGIRTFEPSPHGAAWIARADGSAASMLPGLLPEWGPYGQHWSSVSLAWSRDSRRLAYASRNGLHVVELPSRRDRLVVRSVRARHLAWSPDGQALAFHTDVAVVLWKAGRTHVIEETPTAEPTFPAGDVGSTLGWSNDGRRLAYRLQGRVSVALVPRGARRTLGQGAWPTWSPVAARLAFLGPKGLMVYEPGRRLRLLAPASGDELSWSPDGRRLALATYPGVLLVDERTGRPKVLTVDPASELSWAPDGRSLAYLTPAPGRDSGWMTDVRTVTPAGRVRVVVASAGSYGGRITSFAWLAPAPTLRLRAASPVDGVYAGGPVSALVANGGRSVFVVCGRVLTSLGDGSPQRLDDRGKVDCQTTGDRSNIVQALALAEHGIVYEVTDVGLSYRWEQVYARLDADGGLVRLQTGSAALGGPTAVAAGTGALLAVSAWPRYPSDQTLFEVVHRGSLRAIARAPVEAASDAPVQPLDVEGDRILTIRRNIDLSVWSADGRKLLLLHVVPRSLHYWYATPADGAALTGDDLVVSGRSSSISVYDAGTGALRRSYLHGGVVQDAARGLAATILDDAVHAVRLSDGRDTLVAPGTFARFDDRGLVIADGARVRVVPWERLPPGGD